MLFKRRSGLRPVPPHPEGERVPPGQFLSKGLPVMTYGATPKIDLASWRLRVFGLVEEEVELDWEAFRKLPWTVIEEDFHCVTQWSALDNTWEGVLFGDLMKLVKARPEARHVTAHCYEGYTTSVSLDALMEEAILAHKHNGQELAREHGWPVRLVVPRRYGWKSAKWVSGLEVTAEDHPGFWELRGYHANGDPWKEERFWPELAR